jgi:hypothetical protein
MKFNKFSFIIALLTLLFTSCTDLKEQVLDEQLGSDLVSNPANIEALINPPYAQLRRTIEWYDYWALQQIPTDETAFPTRGTDWFDNGAWQQLYLHTWTPDHIRLIDVWDVLGQGISRSNTAMHYIGTFPQSATTTQYINEARCLRAYYMYLMVDLFGQVPYRDADDLDFSKLPEVKDRKAATDFIIAELKAVLPNLKTKAQVTSEHVTVGFANALLAKIYLNYQVYAGEAKWGDAIKYADDVINSGEYTVTSDYWSMFQYNVTQSNSEFILTVPMSDEVDMGSGSVWINFTLHYNQVFGTYTSFWNGGCTTSDFVNTFDKVNDTRFYDSRIKSTTGLNQGFLIGQQYNIAGDMIKDRAGAPLIFTPEFKLNDAKENEGIRVIKFAPNPATTRQFSSPNDVPLIRISDIYLVRAEAKFRNGDVAGALADINYIRSRRSAAGKTLPLLTSLTADDILKERGFELYWEGVRRQDMVRFGKLTAARQEKPATDAKKNLYPIPTSALDVNSNLKQNDY